MTGTFIPIIGDDPWEITVEGANLGEVVIVDCTVFGEAVTRDPMAIMNTARAEVTFMVENAGHEAFIQELGRTVENKFILKISSYGFTFFGGFVTHEFIEWDDMPFPYAFTISAIDGITKLREIDYVDENGDPYEDTTNDNYIAASEHMANCISKIGLELLYADGPFGAQEINVMMNWTATNMAGSEHPLKEAYIHRDVFYDADQEGNLTPKKCWDVFKSILEGFGMRIRYGQAAYWIEQLSEFSGGQNTYTKFDYGMNETGSTSISFQDELRPGCAAERDLSASYTGGNGKFGMLPPLRQVKVSYDYDVFVMAKEPDNVDGFGGTWGGTPQKVCIVNPASGGLQPFNFTLTEDTYIPVFRVSFQLAIKTTYTGTREDFKDHRVLFRIYLAGHKGTSEKYYYYKPIDSFDPPPTAAEWKPWSGSPYGSDIDTGSEGWDWLTSTQTYKPPVPGFGGLTEYYEVGFETLEYPAEIDSVTMRACLELVHAIGSDGQVLDYTDYGYEWTISDFRIIASEANQKAKSTKRTEVYSSAIAVGGKDSHDIDLKFNDIGNTLMVSDGSKLLSPGGWGVGGGGDKHLGQLLAEEYHSVRGHPIKLMKRKILTWTNVRCNSLTTWNYADSIFMALQTSHDYVNKELSGTWWAIEDIAPPDNAETIQSTVRKDYDRLDTREPDKLLISRAIVRGIPGDGFTVGDTEFIFTEGDLPDKDEYEEEFIRKKLFVHRNGAKLTYVKADPVGSREHSINNVNNSITLDPNFPLSGRHEITVLLEHGY